MDEIPADTLDRLIAQAKEASQRAYCPYSQFRVGATLLTGNGEMFAGCNVENASYGLSICAERNAIFQMVAQGGRQFQALVVYTPTPDPVAPCGACRQVIYEFGTDAQIISVCDGPDVLRQTSSTLLPHAFGPADLGKGNGESG